MPADRGGAQCRITPLDKCRVSVTMPAMRLAGFHAALLAFLASAFTAVAQIATFSLPDINTGSLRRSAHGNNSPVTPRDYLHQITGWYFGDEG